MWQTKKGNSKVQYIFNNIICAENIGRINSGVKFTNFNSLTEDSLENIIIKFQIRIVQTKLI